MTASPVAGYRGSLPAFSGG